MEQVRLGLVLVSHLPKIYAGPLEGLKMFMGGLIEGLLMGAIPSMAVLIINVTKTDIFDGSDCTI